MLQEAVVNLPEGRDSDECGTYAGDMEGFSENDLHNALDDMADGTIASGAVYSDVEGERQNPELKMVMALMEMMDKPGERMSDADAPEDTFSGSKSPGIVLIDVALRKQLRATARGQF